MENCIYQGKAICTFDLKDESGLYYEERVLEWKQAAADRLLTCMECGAYVYLAAGTIKEPYFAHYDLEECDYASGQESEELKKGKRLLYKLLKRSYPEGFVHARYRMENGIYSTFYCLTEEGKSIAIDYRLQNNSLEKFRLRDTFYQSNQITSIYIMGIRQEKDNKQIDWYQSLLQSSMGYLAFLDTKTESLTLKKSFSYRLGKERRFKYYIKTYPIKELLLAFEGQMICDFTDGCNKIDHQINEEKLRYQKRQKQLHELQEFNQTLREKESERLGAYRRSRLLEEEAGNGDYQKQEQNHSNVNQVTDLNPILLEKCRRMIEEGDAHLVSKKYYDVIMRDQ